MARAGNDRSAFRTAAADAPPDGRADDDDVAPARASAEALNGAVDATYKSFRVRKRCRTCTRTPGVCVSAAFADAVRTCTSHPSRAKYFDNPAQRNPPTAPSGG